MTYATSTEQSRYDLLLRTWLRIRDLSAKVSEEAPYAASIAEEWESRLRSAAEVAPGYVLPDDVSTAVTELLDSLSDLSVAEALDWIDLLPRNVLELAEPETVALEFESRHAAQLPLSDSEICPEAWGRNETRSAVAAAA
jgi:hypothetical protein